jgi:hypothetical protein
MKFSAASKVRACHWILVWARRGEGSVFFAEGLEREGFGLDERMHVLKEWILQGLGHKWLEDSFGDIEGPTRFSLFGAQFDWIEGESGLISGDAPINCGTIACRALFGLDGRTLESDVIEHMYHDEQSRIPHRACRRRRAEQTREVAREGSRGRSFLIE